MRRTIRRDNGGVALFPFLAVLICTMGSLIVLLVLLVQQAQVDAHSLAGQITEADPNADKLQQQLEDATFRRELLEQSRAQTAEQLAEGRAKLAHLEDHLLRLEARARELMARAKSIDEGRQLKAEGRAAAEAELQQLEIEIAKKQAELEAARRRQADAEQWFALIPYEGPNRTRRRPIYIECTSAGIVLQPEGIVFHPEDFDGPLGPGNPLDAALRTVREHINQTAGERAGNPYPLLVVRPSGVVAYGAARAALKSWDDEFGYELVEDDKQLVFGDPDPTLTGALKKSVSIARQRQAAMMAMMPRRYANDEPLTSFSPEVALRDAAPRNGPAGRGIGSGEGGHGYGAGGAAGGSGYSPGSGDGRDDLTTGPDLVSAGGGGVRGQGSTGQPGGGQPGGNQPGGSAGPYGSPGAMGQLASPLGGNGMGQGQGASGPGAPTNMSADQGAQSGPNGSPAAGSSPSGQQAGQFGAAGSPAAGESGGSGTPGPSTDSPANGQQAANGKSRRAGSGASRGSNWALPGANRHATAITRPIYVAATPDRLVLLPERGDNRPPQTIRIAPEMTVQQVDAFVSAVQREMKGWGLAVENGYWKPVLQVEVAPGAEHQYQTLRSALENSGFDVNRKQVP